MDVKSAFMNGVLEEEVYVEQPHGYMRRGKEKKVLRLKKTLYGLKEASRAWNERIDTYFKKNRYEQYPYEHVFYIKKKMRRCDCRIKWTLQLTALYGD